MGPSLHPVIHKYQYGHCQNTMLGKSNDLFSGLGRAKTLIRDQYSQDRILYASSGNVFISKKCREKPRFYHWYFAKKGNVIITDKRICFRTLVLCMNFISMLVIIGLLLMLHVLILFILPSHGIFPELAYLKYFLGFISTFVLIVFLFGMHPYSKDISFDEIESAALLPTRMFMTLPLLRVTTDGRTYHCMLMNGTCSSISHTLRMNGIGILDEPEMEADQRAEPLVVVYR